MLSVKQVGINYHFLSLWYDWTWDWTPVSRTIAEGKYILHSNLSANDLVMLKRAMLVMIKMTEIELLKQIHPSID